MFVIVVYDVGVDRVQNFMKICRKYLHHVQRSVFEGELSESKINMLINELRRLIRDGDEVILYVLSVDYNSKYIKRMSLTFNNYKEGFSHNILF